MGLRPWTAFELEVCDIGAGAPRPPIRALPRSKQVWRAPPNCLLTIMRQERCEPHDKRMTETGFMAGDTGQLQRLTDGQVNARPQAYNHDGSLERDVRQL